MRQTDVLVSWLTDMIDSYNIWSDTNTNILTGKHLEYNLRINQEKE